MHDIEESLAALKDQLSDGQWYPITKIFSKVGKLFTEREQLREELDYMVSTGEAIAGTNNSFRMTHDSLTRWREGRGMSMVTTPRDMGAPRVFDGILEDDIWASAPLRSMDVVHFHAAEDVSRVVKDAVNLHGMTLYNFEGLVRIFSLEGDFAYGIVQELSKATPSLGITGIRIDRNVKRRELVDIPEQFLSEMFEFYGDFAHILVRKSKSSIEKHIPEKSDVQQQVYLWIIDAIQRYDDATSIPFAAYLATSLNRWVHDLPRKSFGRAISDAELHISRARTQFLTRHNRRPTLEELAEELGEPVEKVRKKVIGVSNVAQLRDPESIEDDEGREIPIASPEDSTRRYHEEMSNSLLSMALTTSSLEHQKGPQVKAWLSIYGATWGGEKQSKTTSAEREVMEDMRHRLHEEG